MLLECSSLPFSSIALCCQGVQPCRLPAFKTPKSRAAVFSRNSGTFATGFVVRAFKPAVFLHSPLLLGRSSLPFASLQTPKIPRSSFQQALRHIGHRHVLLERSSLLFASIAPLLLGRPCHPFASLQAIKSPKIHRGSFHQALWPQAFVVRAFKPTVCLHSHLLLGRSSLL